MNQEEDSRSITEQIEDIKNHYQEQDHADPAPLNPDELKEVLSEIRY